MKNPDRKTISRLEDLPNIGKAMAEDLRLIGIDHPKKLIGKDPFKLYDTLCKKTGVRLDPCVLDTFMSAVHFMETGEPRPWWSFTEGRKQVAKARNLRVKTANHKISDKTITRAKNAGLIKISDLKKLKGKIDLNINMDAVRSRKRRY
jgi:hypothetical protein